MKIILIAMEILLVLIYLAYGKMLSAMYRINILDNIHNNIKDKGFLFYLLFLYILKIKKHII